jgi:hypothetical protein
MSARKSSAVVKKVHDPVNHPKHYTFGTIEVIEVIEDWELGFHLGNVIKYAGRAGKKDDEIEDLEKAQFYLNRYIDKRKRELGRR